MTFRQMVLKTFLANIRRYLVYYLCVFFSMTVFFLFTSIWFTPDFDRQTTPGVKQIIMIGWILTIIFAFLLLGYSHNQFSKTRFRELGILLSYGLLYKDVRRMVLFENSIIYLVSLFSAFITGGIFSKLFFLMTTSILGIENVKFALTLNSFLLTSICFVPAFCMIILMTLIKTRKLSIVSLVKESRQREMKASGSLLFGMLGIVVILCTLTALYYYNNDPWHVTNMKKTSLIAFVLCLIGIYLLIHNFSILLYSFVKRKAKSYNKNLINLAEFSHRYKQNRTMIFLLCILSFGAVMFTSMSYTLYSQSYLMVEKEQSYDVMLKESEGLDYLKGIDYDKILSNTEAKIEKKATLEVIYLTAENIVPESHRPNRWVPIASVDEYNHIFGQNYSVDLGSSVVVNYSGQASAQDLFNNTVQLKDDQHKYSYKKVATIQDKIFYRYAFGQPVLILVNGKDFMKLLGESEKMNQGKIHMVQYNDWRDGKNAVEKLTKAIGASYLYWNKLQPKVVREINQKYYGFELISKYQQYEHNRQVGGFALFVMSFISMFFVIAICVLVYFKVLSDQEEDKKKIFTLSTVGITSKQIKRYLYTKLKMIMIAPIILGSVIAIGFGVSINIGNTMEWDITVLTVLYNSVVVALLYWGIILIYYIGLRGRFYRRYL